MADFPKIEEAWIWPESVERWFRERAEAHTIHVCCGRSQLGDVRVDRDPEHDPDVVADHANLPFESNTFDTAIWDPPWKMSAFDRHPPYFELVRCVKPDGVLLVNSTWIPTSNQTEVEKIHVRQDNDMGNASLLTKSVHYPGQERLDSDRWVENNANV